MTKLFAVITTVVGICSSGIAMGQEGILMKFSSAVPVPTWAGSFTQLVPDVVLYDTEGMIDPAYPGDIVIPSQPNFTHLEVKMNIVWEAPASSTPSIRQIKMQLIRAGAVISVPGLLHVIDHASAAGYDFIQHASSAVFPVQPGDRILFQATQTTGSTLNIRLSDATWIYAQGVNLR